MTIKPKGSQFTQLPMFMSPAELKTDVGHADAASYGSKSDMWAIKRQESSFPGSVGDSHQAYKYAKETGDQRTLEGDIAQQGVHVPAELFHEPGGGTTMWDGHHRTEVAARVRPNQLMPVVHHDMGNMEDISGYSRTRSS